VTVGEALAVALIWLGYYASRALFRRPDPAEQEV
jgi:hypothetical protein